MIGFGTADTTVISIDRNPISKTLAYALHTTEPEIKGSLTDYLAVGMFDPEMASADYNQYKWLKFIDGAEVSLVNVHVRFTDDGNKLLVLYRSQLFEQSVLYLDASTGALIGTDGYKKTFTTGDTLNRDALTLTTTGDTVFYLTSRSAEKSIALMRLEFDGTNNWSPAATSYSWFAENNFNIPDQRPSIVLSKNQNYAWTFTTSDNGSNGNRRNCRMDLWDNASVASGPNISLSPRNRGSDNLGRDRNCRFPQVHDDTSDGNLWMITLITEYVNTSAANYRAGFLRVKIKSTYAEKTCTAGGCDEKIFTGHDYRFLSAYYKSVTEVYAFAVDQSDQQSYLVFFDWNDATRFLRYPLKVYSENPMAGTYLGNPPLDVILYDLITDVDELKNDLPVRGFLGGSSQKIWAWDDCLMPDFGIVTESYKQMISSPGTGSKLGFLSRLDLNVDSCQHDTVTNEYIVTGANGDGRRKDNRNLDINVYAGGMDENGVPFTAIIKTLADTGTTTTLSTLDQDVDYAVCAIQSADDTTYTFTQALFEGDDIIEYEISTTQVVPFVDWLVDPLSSPAPTCSDVDIDYLVREWVDPNKSPATTNLNIALSDTNWQKMPVKQITFNTNDSNLHGVKHKITVLGRTPSFQCVFKDFTVLPYSCTETTITGAFWMTGSLATYSMDYSIGQGDVIEQFKWVSSLTKCLFEVIIEEETGLNTNVWVPLGDPTSQTQDPTVIIISKETVTPQGPGQNLWDAKINTNALIDTGSGLVGPTIRYKVTVASPDLATVTASSSTTANPVYLYLEISFKNECRDLVLTQQTFTSLENIVGFASVPMYINPAFSFSVPAPPVDCGDQTVTVRASTDPLVNYALFLTPSGTANLRSVPAVASTLSIGLQSNNDAHAGDYYVQLEVSFAKLPALKFLNYDTIFVRLKKSCKQDTVTEAKWVSTNSQTIANYNHKIGTDSDLHRYIPTAATTFSYCSVNSWFQQKDGAGNWVSYSAPPLISFDPATQQVTVTTAKPADDPLQGTTNEYRVALASTTLLADALNPQYLTFTVTWEFVDPCNSATFLDNGFAPAKETMTPYSPTHPSPIVKPVADFPLSGSLSCGLQTISIVNRTPLLPGSLPDFISIAKNGSGNWEITLAPTNLAQIGNTYLLSLSVTLDSYPLVPAFTSNTIFEVEIRDSCTLGVVSNFQWTSPISTSLLQKSMVVGKDQVIEGFTASVNLSYCTIAYTLELNSPYGSGTFVPYTGGSTVDSATKSVRILDTNSALDATVQKIRVSATASDPYAASLSYQYIDFEVAWQDTCKGTWTVGADFKWTSNSLSTLPQQDVTLIDDTKFDFFSVTSAIAHCLTYVLEVETAPGTYTAFADPRILLDSVNYVVRMTSPDLTLDGQIDKMRITATTAGVSLQLFFEIRWLDKCKGQWSTAADFKWTSTNTPNFSQVVILNRDFKQEAFSIDASLTFCAPTYVLEIESGGVYSAYTRTDVALNLVLNEVQMTSTDQLLDRQVDKMRIKASVLTNDIYITFEVNWFDLCYELTAVADLYTPFVYATILGDTVKVVADQTMTYAEPLQQNRPCGPISVQELWPQSDIVQKFITFSGGDFTIQATKIEHAGYYKIGGRLMQDNYSRVLMTDYFWLEVKRCIPDALLPPESDVGEVIHVIGEPQTKRGFPHFIQVPACLDTPIYTVLDKDGNKLDTKMEVFAATESFANYLIVETQDLAFAGRYRLQIAAEYPFDLLKSTIPYEFDLVLVKPTYNYTEGISVLFPNETLVDTDLNPDFEYKLPLGVDVLVILGPASEFLDYENGRIFVKKGIDLSHFDPDTYRVIIIFEGKEYYLNLNLWGEEEAKPDNAPIDFNPNLSNRVLDPKIKSIDTFGELILVWDRDMLKPQNETYFKEQLEREVEVVDINTQKLLKKPALEFALFVSYVHEDEDLTMEAEFISWENDRELKFQLTFSDTLAISMEIPADFVNITFWDQNLFSSTNRLQVPHQHSISKQIFPQAERDELADTLVIIAQIFVALIIFAGALGCLMQVLLGFGLNFLWSLLHSLQLIIHLPIFIVQYPGYAFIFYIVMAWLVKFDIIETEDLYVEWFDLDPEEGPYASEYARLLYLGQSWLYNSGFISVTLVLTLLIFGVAKLLPLCRDKYPRVKKFSNKLDKDLYWNFVLRLLLELSLELFIISIMDVSMGNFSTFGYGISFFFALVSIIVVLGIGLISRLYLRKNYDKLKEKSWIDRVGSIYQGLNLKSKVNSLFYVEWFLLRRFIYAATAFFAIGNYWIQFQIMFNCSLFTIWVIGGLRPFDSLYTMRVELVNECFFLMIMYHTTFFTYVIPETKVRHKIGLSAVFWTSACISWQLVIFFSGVAHKLKLVLKRRINRKKMDKIKLMKQIGIDMQQQGRYVDYEQLQRQMNQVEVKAQQTKYLLNPMAGNIPMRITPIPANQSALPPSLSNLNQREDQPGKVNSQRLLLEEEKQAKGPSGHMSNLQNRPGFNIDLNMFSEEVGQGVMKDLTKLWYGDSAGQRPQHQIISAQTAQPSPTKKHDPHLFDLSGLDSSALAMKGKEESQKFCYEDLPAGIGKTIHIDLR